jgi:hypothetical protein
VRKLALLLFASSSNRFIALLYAWLETSRRVAAIQQAGRLPRPPGMHGRAEGSTLFPRPRCSRTQGESMPAA